LNKPVHLTYKIDSILAEHNHSVLRLSPYHPELNLIKLIWATVKNWVSEKKMPLSKLTILMQLVDKKI
ncbi:hypothetical protein C0J52_14033, partial [Blattella germanica]